MTDLPSQSSKSLLPEDQCHLLELAVIVRETLAAGDKPKSKWKEALNSTVVAALVTVILGGWFSNWIVASYQKRDKEQERQIAAASSAYRLLGEAHFRAGTLISLTLAFLQVANFEDAKKPSVQQRRDKIADDATDFRQRWEKEKYTIGLLLGHDPGVHDAWQKAERETESMLDAAQEKSKASREQSIDAEERHFDDAVKNLAVALDRAAK
jgi:signal transduction histidine kinase